MRKQQLYFDYAATTPVDPRVRAAMEPFFSEEFGNPSSIHLFGQRASAAVFAARRTLAGTIGADAREVMFTGSATEANNLALRGIARGYRDQVVQTLMSLQTRRGIGYRQTEDSPGKRPKTLYPKPQPDRQAGYTPNPYSALPPRIIISSIEHESILETARDIERDGVEVVMLPVSRDGIVSLAALRRALNERTVLVSVMYANNEVGTIQPIAEIADIIRGYRDQGIGYRQKENLKSGDSKTPYPIPHTPYPFLHTDAVQAFQYLDCGVDRLGADLMTLSAHKIYGPKGIGALYMRQVGSDKRQDGQKSVSPVAVPLSPVITGGGQEWDMRSGTENVPGIIGFGKAAELAVNMRGREASRIAGLRERFLKLIHVRRPDISLNSSRCTRLPNNVNVYVPGVKAEELVMKLDLRGIAVAAGSACAARALRPSHVLRAMGYSDAQARESVRITFGRATTARDIDILVRELAG